MENYRYPHPKVPITRCMFCGSEHTTNEHIFSRWTHKLFPPREKGKALISTSLQLWVGGMLERFLGALNREGFPLGRRDVIRSLCRFRGLAWMTRTLSRDLRDRVVAAIEGGDPVRGECVERNPLLAATGGSTREYGPRTARWGTKALNSRESKPDAARLSRVCNPVHVGPKLEQG